MTIWLSITLAKGIEYGVSTVDDITNAYGTPTDTYESDIYTKLTYELSRYQDVELYVSTETGTLSEFDIGNFIETEETASTNTEVSDEVPEIVSKYVVPTALGDDNVTNLPITVQKNITRGMTQADLEKALEGTEFEKEDSTSFEYHTISCGTGVLDNIEIVVRKDTAVIQRITVSNSPKTIELFSY